MSPRKISMPANTKVPDVPLTLPEGKEIKCVIWDLDNTLWRGVLIEGDAVELFPGAPETLTALDQRGILCSIASRNDRDLALAKLEEFNVAHYFLYPEIHWGAKSESIGRIQKNLNIGMDTLLFLDDQIFERDEAQSVHPALACLDATLVSGDLRRLLDLPRLNPRFITEDSSRRRQMYLDDLSRQEVEREFAGPKEEFLAGLQMTFIISRAQEHDLKRAEELTVRTNQLNATGRTYSFEELRHFSRSPEHLLLVCELTDRYGSYGKIGLALVELGTEVWHIRLLLMSCRVMNRGVGTVLMSYIMQEAKRAGAVLHADFVDTGRNRMMLITYKFGNFKEISRAEDGTVVFENNLSTIQLFPPFIAVKTP